MALAKKKREHIVFDRDMKTKKSISFSSVNKRNPIKQKNADSDDRNYRR